LGLLVPVDDANASLILDGSVIPVTPPARGAVAAAADVAVAVATAAGVSGVDADTVGGWEGGPCRGAAAEPTEALGSSTYDTLAGNGCAAIT
jgi:hypothetical protein